VSNSAAAPSKTLPKSSWRKSFSDDQVVQRIRPIESTAYLPNPHRGTATFQRFNGDPLNPGLTWSDKDGPLVFKPFDGNLTNVQYPSTTLSYCRWVWTIIEPEPRKFRWDIVEQSLEAARLRGQTLQLRLQPYAGGSGLPPWYWNFGKPVKSESTDPLKWEPDHNHPAYAKYFGRLIQAFGKRFDGHPVLESVDIAYAGSCGECGGNSSAATARKLVDIFRKSLRKTQLISMHGTHGCTYGSKFPELGWRHDCYGDMSSDGMGVVPDGLRWNSMYDDIPKGIAQTGVADAWKTAPVTFETCWTVGYWAKQGWNIDWILDQGLRYHATVFMPKSSFIPDEWREKIDAFDRRLGYRFALRQMVLPLESAPGSKFNVDVFMDNVGVAPIYRPYKLALRFKQGSVSRVVKFKQDIRTWLPGQTFFSETLRFPSDFRSGVVEAALGIVDDSDQPRILFAHEGTPDGRWHPLSFMDVVKK
jgi:hypothetical protein